MSLLLRVALVCFFAVIGYAPELRAEKATRDAAQTSDTIARAVEAAETAHDIQREFPGEASEQKIERAPPRLEDAPQPQDTPDWLENLAKFLRPFFKLLGWLLLAGLAALIGYGLYQLVQSYLSRPRREADTQAGEALIDIDADRAQVWLDDAEQLALRGCYGEAVHHLLLNAIEYLKRRSGKPIPRGWTAREIQARLPISTLARALLQLLVQTVERARFAGREIAEADFRRCKDSYEQLLGLRQLQASV